MQYEYYNALVKHINTTLPEIKSVRLWNSQNLNEKVENAFLYPIVFIEFKDQTYTNIGEHVQMFNETVCFHLGFESYKDIDADILTLKQRLHYVLMNWEITPDVNG